MKKKKKINNRSYEKLKTIQEKKNKKSGIVILIGLFIVLLICFFGFINYNYSYEQSHKVSPIIINGSIDIGSPPFDCIVAQNGGKYKCAEFSFMDSFYTKKCVQPVCNANGF